MRNQQTGTAPRGFQPPGRPCGRTERRGPAPCPQAGSATRRLGRWGWRQQAPCSRESGLADLRPRRRSCVVDPWRLRWPGEQGPDRSNGTQRWRGRQHQCRQRVQVRQQDIVQQQAVGLTSHMGPGITLFPGLFSTGGRPGDATGQRPAMPAMHHPVPQPQPLRAQQHARQDERRRPAQARRRGGSCVGGCERHGGRRS